jgi:hypothetical protein
MKFVNYIKASGVAARARGQAMVEYGLILVLVSVVAVVGLTVVGGQLYNPTMVNPIPAADGTISAAAYDLSDIEAATPATPRVHIRTAADSPALATGHTPGAFNQILFALSNSTRVV